MNKQPSYDDKPNSSHSYTEGKRREAKSYRPLVLDKMGFKPGDVVLDLGSGRGEQADYIQTLTQTEVIRIDPSEAALKLQQIDNKSNIVVQADALHLPLADESVDKVHSKDMVVHIEDKKALFRELSRILKPLGMVVITTQRINDNFFAIDLARQGENDPHKRETIHFEDGQDLQSKLSELQIGTEFNGEVITDVSPPYFTTNTTDLEKAAIASGFFKDTVLTEKINGSWMPREGDIDWVSVPRAVLVFRKLRQNIKRA